MKIGRLEIEGFGPFRDTQTIDLRPFAGDGIFLISGRTGAGKSSILDAICFALYGSTPRYSEGEKRLRSDYAAPGDPTRVVLEFEVGDEAWRIERSPEYERPKQRGEGTTTQRSSVEVFVRDGSGWRGVASREKEANARINAIVGMTSSQFQQVILLAQGRFARFLLARNDDRMKLLRSLFDTSRFADYEAALEDRRRAAEAAVGERTRGLELMLDQAQELVEQALASESEEAVEAADAAERAADAHAETPPAAIATGAGEGAADVSTAGRTAGGSPDAVEAAPGDGWAARIGVVASAADAADRRREACEAALARAAEASADAERADDERRATLDRQRSRDAARERIAELDAERVGTDAARAELDAARRAATVKTAIEAAARADADDAAARAVETRERERWAAERAEAGVLGAASGPPRAEASGDLPAVDAPADDLDAFASRLHTLIGTWEPVRLRESGLAREEAGLDAHRAELKRREARVAEIDDRAAALPRHLDAARKSHDAAAKRADQAEAVAEHIRDLEAQFAAVREAGELSRSYAASEQAVRRATSARDVAERALSDLHRRRLAGYSGELARQLADGEPCAVCGATDHPSPAVPGDDQVTPDQIEEADAARAEAVAALEAAVEARQQADLALRDAQRRSGGRTETDVNGDLIAEQRRSDEVAAAARDRDRLAERISALEKEQADLGDDRTGAIAACAELAATIEADEKALAADRAAVADARGAHRSVAERIGATQRLASGVAACADASRAAAHAAAAARAARESLESALAEARFVVVTDAVAAQRPVADLAALESRIREADDARGAAERTLAELAELPLPDDLVDRAETQAALVLARQEHAGAAEARAEAEQLSSALAAALERARTAHAKIGAEAERAAVIARLANTVAGRAPNDKRMSLETFVLAAELEEIVQAANARLAAMSGSRYTLRHSDAIAHRNAASGLGIEVFDAHTGRARPPQSLSGGETFLASLALALGLAEVVTSRSGGIRLDTLFIDEGFGSLDSETLEVAMRTLDDLRQGGRIVGLISHVEQMKEQIPARLRVEQTPQGWSVVRQE